MKNKPKIDPRIIQIITGISILAGGMEDLERFNQYPLSISFILFTGVFTIAGALFHKTLFHFIRKPEALFNTLEGALQMISAYLMLSQDPRKMIPLFLIFIGLTYFAIGAAHLLETPENRKKVWSRFVIAISVSFIFFSVAISVYNTLKMRKLPAYITAGIYLVMGVVLLLIKNKLKFEPAPDAEAPGTSAGDSSISH